MREIKIIVLDLDGTLLTSDKKISPRNSAALERAAERGIHIVPSTGRFYGGMPDIVRELPFVRYAITVNGAEIYDAREQKVLHRSEITPQQADEVFEVLDQLPVVYDCYQEGWGWMEKGFYDKAGDFIDDPRVLAMVKELRTPVEDFRGLIRQRGKGVQKIQMFFRDMDARAEALPMLRQRFPGLNVTSSIANNLELNSLDAHKGAALLELCRCLGVDPAQTMAFGDGLNDITMLQTAALGVAMENAYPEVKAAANFVTDTNDRDGVAKAIEQFCL